MLKKEQQYDFRKRLLQVHEANLRCPCRTASKEEYLLPEGTVIALGSGVGQVTETAVRDFIDFLWTSMNLSARMAAKGQKAQVTVALAAEAGVDLGEAASYKGFRLETDAEGIRVFGHDERGIAQGLYYLETLMTFEKAPLMPFGAIQKKPMFAPRMIHSGYGLDEYPDEYLARVAHEGRDAILVFTKDADRIPDGYLNFNDLIRRAARYGLDVYAYSYIVSDMNPESPEAETYYENTYGKLFRQCPGLAGVTLVGESVEFPSRDPHVSPGRLNQTSVDGIPTGKVTSGWYPCEDYPLWLELLKRIIGKYNKNADIVFWSYNWGRQPEEARVKLIESLPEGISLQATFEMYQPRCYGNSMGVCSDYTLSFEGPGDYFKSEAIAAKKRGIRLYSMTNTGGQTWDFGVTPYEPMPYQWIRRYKAMQKAHDDWGLCGLMESHHYGFTPSFISKLSNLVFLEPREPMEAILEKILKAEYGQANYERVNQALLLWSEAIRHYTPSNLDQYGAFRVGPSFPFCLSRRINVPTDPRALFGNVIIEPIYDNGSAPLVSPLSLRIREEKASLERMRDYMEQGIALLATVPEANEKLERLLNLGRFISCSVQTGIHAKEWHILKCRLYNQTETAAFGRILNQMEALLHKELENTEAAIPLIEADSRLGWEPSMLYVTDRWHLEWKIRQVRHVLDWDLARYRESLSRMKDF